MENRNRTLDFQERPSTMTMTADFYYRSTTTCLPHEQHVDDSCYRVRIFPGPISSSSSTPPPPPPSSLPPKPSHLCKIAVVGDALVGKSSIVQKLIHRHYVGHRYQHNIELDGINESGNKSNIGSSPTINFNGGATSYNSMGTSSFPSGGRYCHGGVERGDQSTFAEYYKKDITIWSECNDKSSNAHDVKKSITLQNTNPICIRVQCWDMNIPPQFIHPLPIQTPTPIHELDPYHCDTQSVSSDLQTPIYNDHNNSIAESLLQLIKQVDGILIVCRCPPPPTTITTSSLNPPHYVTNSSNASYVSHTTDVSSSGMGASVLGWPELDSLQNQIRSYTSFLRDGNINDNIEQLRQQEQATKQQEKRRQQPIIYLLLSCADLAAGEYSPRQYVKLSNKMDELCNECGVASWRMGTCIDTRNNDGCGSSSIDELSTTAQQRQRRSSLNLLQRMMKQQLHLMEDMEDAIEGIFVDMIYQVLVGRREEERRKTEHN